MCIFPEISNFMGLYVIEYYMRGSTWIIKTKLIFEIIILFHPNIESQKQEIYAAPMQKINILPK
eukprot:UN13295